MTDLEKANDLLRRMADWETNEKASIVPVLEDIKTYLATQPEPVDPDLLAAREIVAAAYETGKNGAEQHRKEWAAFCRNGSYDADWVVANTLAGIKHGRGK